VNRYFLFVDMRIPAASEHNFREGAGQLPAPLPNCAWLYALSGAGDETRTRDSLLGRYLAVCAVASFPVSASSWVFLPFGAERKVSSYGVARNRRPRHGFGCFSGAVGGSRYPRWPVSALHARAPLGYGSAGRSD
jgi:hypothetical protein